MINQIIAEKFEEIADMLEVLGDGNVFRLRAYRRGAEAIRGYSSDVGTLLDEEIEKIPGIGKDLHSKILEYKSNGEIQMHKELLAKLSPGVLQILKIRGVGPKKARLFLEQLGIDSVEKLKGAAESGAIATLPKMGEKSAKLILEAISQSSHLSKRIPIYLALPEAEAYVKYMKEMPEVKKAEYAGSLRRRRETIGDIDILTVGTDPKRMSERFLKYPKVKQVLAAGETRSSVIIEGDIQVDFRVLDENSFGAALYYFTGSKQHNIATRTIAIKRNLKINEYGVFKGEENIASNSEVDVFKAIGLPYIPPEIREDQGEIEAALAGKLPELIEEADLRGDLHIHTKNSDGSNSIYEMAIRANELGREYIAISDHMTELAEVKNQAREIAEVRKKLIQEGLKIKILHSAELNILKNGLINLPVEAMKMLDLVLISVHSAFNLSRNEQTERIISALKNPYAKILCHPTTRLISRREEIDVDMEKIVRAAKEFGKILEINAQPDRMDMNGAYARLCKNEGVKVAINTDSHNLDQLTNLKYGIFMARRGWIEKKDVLNCLTYKELINFLK